MHSTLLYKLKNYCWLQLENQKLALEMAQTCLSNKKYLFLGGWHQQILIFPRKCQKRVAPTPYFGAEIVSKKKICFPPFVFLQSLTQLLDGCPFFPSFSLMLSFLSLSLSLSLSISLYLSIYIYLSLSISLSLYLYLPLPFSLYLSVSPTACALHSFSPHFHSFFPHSLLPLFIYICMQQHT